MAPERSVDHPRLLPAVLVPDPDGTREHGRLRRTTRDWLVDATVFVLALGVGALFVGAAAERDDIPGWLLAVDVAAGVLLCLSLWFRRRWPVALAILSIPLGAVSAMAGPPGSRCSSPWRCTGAGRSRSPSRPRATRCCRST